MAWPRGDDQAGATRAGVGRRRAEPIGRARREILDEDVRALDEPREDIRATGFLEIERQRLLGSIQPDEVARESLDGRVVPAREVAAVGPLDLDDAGAKVRELPRRERRRDRLLERHDGDVFEWQHTLTLASPRAPAANDDQRRDRRARRANLSLRSQRALR